MAGAAYCLGDRVDPPQEQLRQIYAVLPPRTHDPRSRGRQAFSGSQRCSAARADAGCWSTRTDEAGPIREAAHGRRALSVTRIASPDVDGVHRTDLPLLAPAQGQPLIT